MENLAPTLAEKQQTIKNWPAAERPREKLLKKGAQSLSDAELLAIFLRTGYKGFTAVDLARQLLQTFGGLKPMLQATEQQFCQQKGLGPAKYSQLQAVLEMSKRHLLEQVRRGEVLSCPQQTKQFLMAELGDYPHEVFACLFLNTKNSVISFDKMFYGTINGASVYPREIVHRALQKNAASVIFAHNHPSGSTQPSQADKHITQRLKKALALIDVSVLDHFIIGDEVVSFAERGLL